MPGYDEQPDLTAQAIVDGWLHTGDQFFSTLAVFFVFTVCPRVG
jgi:long-subunit acyl-CoA synthetase (AMP-forming)